MPLAVGPMSASPYKNRLVQRVFDFKADRKKGILQVLSCRFEDTNNSCPASARDREAARTALVRYAGALELKSRG